MLRRSVFSSLDRADSTRWLIVIFCAIVLMLEYLTLPSYVFGYLYIGAILLASSKLRRSEIFQVMVVSAILTFSNLWFPSGQLVESSTIANRIITVIALVVTGLLEIRNRDYQDAIAQQQSQLQAQEQLSRLREDFVSTLTHDLKTPLLGAIETIKAFQRHEFGIVSSTQQKIFDMMARSHQTTLQMVEMMLDVYRNDAEGLQLDLEPLNLTDSAEDAIVTLRDLAATRRVYLSTCHGDSDFRRALWVMGDRLQLQRVFTNLLANSINHSPRGGKVEVSLESYSSHQIVKILDTGPGITPEELPHLFERFYQGHSDRQAKGSGLGLYLTRQIIEAHGGTIWAENRSPHGALFAFRLPATSTSVREG
ncbi:sensor histidine kinase [Phormidesmis sp. 146-35]